ncbi:hypothetical protein [Cobetia amphilecti]|uniref:hypothetical protein n=1 Tax=Cobetia amphilecti TaxID=1055104 RepID=UPI0034C62221
MAALIALPHASAHPLAKLGLSGEWSIQAPSVNLTDQPRAEVRFSDIAHAGLNNFMSVYLQSVVLVVVFLDFAYQLFPRAYWLDWQLSVFH